MSTEAEATPTPLRLLYIYAHEDKNYRDTLDKHLITLKRAGVITTWSDYQIAPGTDRTQEITKQIYNADIVLLLVTPDFIASDYVYSGELRIALERHERGETRVIPILLRSVDWEGTPFSKLQALPTDARPITRWQNQDEAFADVARGIRRVIADIQSRQTLSSVAAAIDQAPRGSVKSSVSYRLPNVFVKSGFPEVTFVRPSDFAFLKLALEQPGRGVVIEGPSGVGKTTAVEKAVDELKKARSKGHIPIQKILSARNPEHRRLLQTLREWHDGTVIIDDFHRLDLALQQELVDYLKELADTTAKTKKLAIVGIPHTGQSLVDASFDIATRLDIFTMGQVKEELIQQMIEKGEEALNIRFDRKAEIVSAANGSLNLAQFLCFHLCATAEIDETQEQTKIVVCDIETAKERVMRTLANKFESSIKHFIAMGGPRNVIGLRLLEELAATKDGFLSLPELKERKTDLAADIEGFISNNWMDRLYTKYPDSAKHLFFEPIGNALVIDDPQMAFYLKNVRFSSLARQVGKITQLAERKVFISYSHKDAVWLERLRVHLKPIERDGIIDLWDDTKIAVGMQWKGAIQDALETSRAAVLLISGDFLASDFIAEHELPKILKRAEAGGTIIIPINLSPSIVSSTALGEFQAVNTPEDTILGMDFSRQEQTFVRVAQTIMQRFKTG